MNNTGLAEFESILRPLRASPTLVSLKDAVNALAQTNSTPGSSRNMQGAGYSSKLKTLPTR